MKELVNKLEKENKKNKLIGCQKTKCIVGHKRDSPICSNVKLQTTMLIMNTIGFLTDE